MNKENLYPIGTIAKLFSVSVSILRHYEKIGLLIPAYIDKESNYRYYSLDQFEVLNTIRYLRGLDMSLDDIKEFLNNRDISFIEGKLKSQKEEVIKKRKELERIEKKIDNRLEQLEDALNSKLDVIEEIDSHKMNIVMIKEKVELHAFVDMEKHIRKLDSFSTESNIFLGKVGVGVSKEQLQNNNFNEYDSVFLILDKEDSSTSSIPLSKSKCVRIRYCGTHLDARKYYKKLIEYIQKKHYEIINFSREISMIDYGFTSDESKFVIEISIPVKKMEN